MERSGEDLEHSEATFEGVDKVKLFSQSWIGNKQDIRAVFVILHGLKDHSSRYSELAAIVAQKGFAVYAFDLRGHGRSGGKRAFVGKFDDLVADLEIFTKQVRDKNAGKSLFIFGHSMGGTTVTLAAISNVKEFQGIILSAPALVPGAGISTFLIKITRVLGILMPSLPLMNLPNRNFSRDPLVIAGMASDPLIYNKNAPVRTAAQLLGAMDKIQKNIQNFATPVLILHGTADKLTNPEGSKRLAERAKSTDKTLKLYPGLVHDLVHEPEKAQVIEDIMNWLEKHAT
jgi:alpha-beta hydrolase superfamily lysophospholipase